ncbi:hypothetical protein HYDPIDRAFT_117478 [Hydnomerulius pinastri MD-312]|uniref:F-box domain-containing protein n=1 Tax=Hydnomerulius pinastri MD-312 TaxID=994086 RepID=A0A0C9VR42_9AGAM|nr:hypothetical protein HYDPIDRAFT_117478 [Hydnomerulius pinastri MD-312]
MNPGTSEETPRLTPPPTAQWSLSEYQWGGLEHVDISSGTRKTTLTVVFDGESRYLFSSARIVLCCRSDMSEERWRGWEIQQEGSGIHTLRSKVHETKNDAKCQPSHAPSNDWTLSSFTAIFEIVHHESIGRFLQRLRPATGKVILRSTDHLPQLNDMRILLESEESVTPDTLSLSLTFTHSTKLYTPLDLVSERSLSPPPHFLTTRVVRVFPPSNAGPLVARGGLPTEILLSIFRYVVQADRYSGWRRDLVSFALVCHNWTCSLALLLWDFKQPYRGLYWQKTPPNIYALARALTERPVLGLSIKHLSTEYFRVQRPRLGHEAASLAEFTSAFIVILRSTKKLQTLRITDLDTSQADALVEALYDLRELHTLTTGNDWSETFNDGVLSIVQIAYCLATWPSLKSLSVYGTPPADTTPGTTLRPPVCSLTELTISGYLHMTDEELMYILSSSSQSLERVTLDFILGITNTGLRTFLSAISQNVSSLTIQFAGYGYGKQHEELALDAVIGGMPRLRQLRIKGDLATESMLDRRAKLFVASSLASLHALNSKLPVIELWVDDAPQLHEVFTSRAWPGWKICKRPGVEG